MSNIQHRPLQVSPLAGDNDQAPGLIIGVVGTPLSNDQKAAGPDGRNISATAVESTDDQMIRIRTDHRAPIRLNQEAHDAANRRLKDARPFIETPN